MNLFTLSLAIFSLSNIPSTSQQTVHQQSACNELRTILNSETSEQCHPITQIKGLDCWQPLITKISSETEMPLAFKLMELEDACEAEHKQLRKGIIYNSRKRKKRTRLFRTPSDYIIANISKTYELRAHQTSSSNCSMR